MLAAIGFNVSSEDRALIGSIMKGWNITVEPRIIDVRTNILDLDGISIVLCFGQRAKFAVETYSKDKKKHVYLADLPALSDIHPVDKGGKTEERKKVVKVMDELYRKFFNTKEQSLNEDNDLIQSIRSDMIPDLSLGVIQELSKKLASLGRKDWTCITSGDKVVRITFDPQTEKPAGVDSDITFAELMLIRAAMDIFQVKEVRFVPKSTDAAQPDKAS